MTRAEKLAEKALEAARSKVVREELFARLPLFVYHVSHVERHQREEDWTCRLSASKDGVVVSRLCLTVKTPSPLDFDRGYAFDLLSLCPLWVRYDRPEKSYVFSENVRRKLDLEDL